MPRLIVPDGFEPNLQFRYKVLTSKIPGAHLYGRSAGQPDADNQPVEMEHINYTTKYKGKTKWNSISMTFYQYRGITAQEIWQYFNTDHQNVEGAVDQFGTSYKHDLQIQLLDPDGESPNTTWTLIGAFFENVKWGDLDWGNNDAITIDATIVYDYALQS